jgi:hypothetical protein
VNQGRICLLEITRGAAAKSLQREEIYQLVASWVHQQPAVAQEVHSNDGELNSGQQKGPN